MMCSCFHSISSIFTFWKRSKKTQNPATDSPAPSDTSHTTTSLVSTEDILPPHPAITTARTKSHHGASPPASERPSHETSSEATLRASKDASPAGPLSIQSTQHEGTHGEPEVHDFATSANTRRASGAAANLISKSQKNANSKLRQALLDARFEWPRGESRWFLPASEMERLLTSDGIEEELSEYHLRFEDERSRRRMAEGISANAPKLFAMLIYLRKGHTICDFVQEGIGDSHLPFERDDKTTKTGDFKLCRQHRPKEPIQCMLDWDRDDIIHFERDQWCTRAPIFSYTEGVEHYEFEQNLVLPFIIDHEHSDHVKNAGFSRVWKVVIHHAHQKLFENAFAKDKSPAVALKRLYSTNEAEFQREVQMLKAFSTKRHKNLVKLLATYRYRGDYYLLFPWAEKNLREYWQTTPVPEFTDTTLSWSLHQCKAIASALHVIHENRTTAESREARAALHAARFGIAGSSTEVDDRLFGRHGDLKPENILFSMEDVEDDNGISHAQGLLLIADFGLCELHRKMTRSKILADRITGSATYVPPEAKSSKHINRKYDIWSLGCVYLEYVTWLLQGWEALNRFSEQRAQTAQDNINDDTFFTITGNTTTLRKGVQDHIKALHDDPRCSTFIHDFLDLISGGMLVANPAKRWESGQVNARLFTMLDRWKKDLFYLSKAGLERPKRSSTIFSTNSSLSEAPKKGSPLPTRQSTAMSGQSVVTASQQVGFALERTLSPTGYRN